MIVLSKCHVDGHNSYRVEQMLSLEGRFGSNDFMNQIFWGKEGNDLCKHMPLLICVTYKGAV